MNAQHKTAGEAGITHIAAIYPFEEVNGSRVMLNPPGPNRWDITSAMRFCHPMTQQHIQEVVGQDTVGERLRFLRELPHVPAWVREWEGQYELHVTRPLPCADVGDVVPECTRFVAKFIAQAWQGDEASPVSPRGPVLWEVTSLIDGERDERIRLEMLEGSCEAADELAMAPNAPDWVRTWVGPFEVTVNQVEPHQPMPLSFVAEGPLPVTADDAAVATLPESIPDSDVAYGRGFRDGLASIALALKQLQVRPRTIASALMTAVEAYGNNADVARPDVIEEMLVVSLAHLDAVERTISTIQDMQRLGIPHLIPCFSSDHGLIVNVPGPDVIDPGVLLVDLEGKVTGGFSTCVMRAIQTGASYLYFDRDVEPMAGCPVYDDLGNSDLRRA